MKKQNKILIVLTVLLLLPFLRGVRADVHYSYPVLEWDEEPPLFVGKEFYVMFTAFSDANETIHAEIWLDDVDLEWEGHALYFVNQLVLIDTEDQLAGENHKIEITATDYLGRTKNLTSFFTIDSIAPVYNELSVYPSEDQKVTINKDTNIMISWDVSDDYFRLFYVERDYDIILSTKERVGKWNYSYYSTESAIFTLTCVAIDRANNTATRYYSVYYNVEEGEFVPQDEVDKLLAQQKTQRNLILGGAGVAIVISIPFAVVALIIFSKKKKEMNL